jgi:sodium-dependent dicarboxylate transporter 2/3/5
VPITKMLRSGVVFDVIGAILILIGVPLVVELVGIGG